MNRPFVKEAHRVVSLADGVVTLSETDRLYWSLFNPVSVCIPNPCFVEESAARWTSLIEGLEKGARPNTPRLDEATEALLDEIYDHQARALDSLSRERDQEREHARRLEAERASLETAYRSLETSYRSLETAYRSLETAYRSLETAYRSLEADLRSLQTDRGALEADREFWKSELYATRDTVSFRVGRFITWLPRKLRGGVRCYREHGGKYTFYRLLYHLRLAPNNEKRGK